MGLLKDFLRIDAERRSAHQTLRQHSQQRRAQIEELNAEARRKRDEIGILEEGLRRLAEDVSRAEQALLGLHAHADDFDQDAVQQKADAIRDALASDCREGTRVAEEYRRVRSALESERERLLAQTDTGRMMDNYFQIETFLKDTAQPIPDAARKALLKERADLLARIGPLVAPPPTPDAILRMTIVYAALMEGEPRAFVALGLPEETESEGAQDLPSALLYGAYAAVVEKLGTAAPRPRREGEIVVFEMPAGSRAPDEVALELFLGVEDGLKRAAAAASVRCEVTGVFVEPEIAAAVFVREALRQLA